jgi:hypothetical protein
MQSVADKMEKEMTNAIHYFRLTVVLNISAFDHVA